MIEFGNWLLDVHGSRKIRAVCSSVSVQLFENRRYVDIRSPLKHSGAYMPQGDFDNSNNVICKFDYNFAFLKLSLEYSKSLGL